MALEIAEESRTIHMIGLSRAGPVWNENAAGFDSSRKKISISFRYRLGLKRSGLAETALRKLLKIFGSKILICLDENHFLVQPEEKI